jgi:hypothetical protein
MAAIPPITDPALSPLERRVHRRQRRREDRCRPRSLEEPSGDQPRPVRGSTRHHARGHEDTDADEEQPASTVHVADLAERDEKGGEHERVDRVDPFGVGQREVEVADDRRQGDVDDRRIDDDHRHAEAQDREAEPTGA